MNALTKDSRKAAARVGLTADTIAIDGGKPLVGTVDVRGAKNLVTKAMVAALLAESPSVLRDVPDISDVKVVTGMLEATGLGRPRRGRGAALRPVQRARAHFAEIDALAGSSRILILFCGPLLHRLGEALIPDLGGCRIGDRPIDFHMDALRLRRRGRQELRGHQAHGPERADRRRHRAAYRERRRDGAGAAHGRARARHDGAAGAAIEPEIMDLIAILQKMGAIINVEPNCVIFIEGVEHLIGYEHRAIFDRNEAASWASAALATRGDIVVAGARQQELMTFLNVFRKVGGAFDVREDGIRFWHPGGDLRPVVIETDAPRVMTDWQQPLIVALTQAHGHPWSTRPSTRRRFGFTEALCQMGANITVHATGLRVRVAARAPAPARAGRRDRGPTHLHGADIEIRTSGAGSATSSRRSRRRALTVSNVG